MARDIWGAAVDRSLSREGFVNTIDDRDPETVRTARKVGRQLGIAGPIVEADLEGFNREAEGQKTKTILDYAPGLAAFISNPDNAAATKDDLPTMAEISRMLGHKPEPAMPIGTAEQTGDPLGRRFIERMSRSTTSPWALQRPRFAPTIRGPVARAAPDVQPNEATVGNVARGLEAGIIGGISKASLGIEQAVADTLGFGDWYRSTDYYRSTRVGEQKREREADIRYQPQGQVAGVDINLGQWAYQASTSLGQLGAGIATGQPLGFISALSGGEFYERTRQRGASHKEALRGAVGTGLIEAGTEKLPMDFLVNSFGKKGVGSFLGGFLAREAPTEVMATVGQGAIDALTTGGEGWDKFVEGLPQDVADTIGTTAFMGGALGTLNLAARRLSPEVRALDDIEQASVGAAFLDKLMTKATESKVRQSDPESFKEFIAQTTAETPVRDIYVPVEAINEYMQSEGYEAGTLEPYQEQIAEAQATQGDVVIPVADAAAYLAGTPAWEALKDRVRLQPGGLSQKEALERHAEIMAVLEQRGAEIAAEVEDNAAGMSDAAAVFSDVRNRLLAGGVESKLAEHTAQVVAARYETRGKRRGVSATEAWKQAGVKFDWETKGKAKGRKLQQSLVIGDLNYEVNEDGTYKVELTAQNDNRVLGDQLTLRELRAKLGDELTARILAGEGGTAGRRAIHNLDLTTRDGGLALREEPKPTATVNIGLAIPTGGQLTPAEAAEALEAIGVQIRAQEVRQSATEPTLIAEIDRALTPEEGTRLSESLQQEAIAQLSGGEGALFGPQAEKWGPFNPDFFLPLSRQQLLQSDTFTSLPEGGDTDPVGRRVVAFHGTPFEFDEFKPGKAAWFSEGRPLAEMYSNPRRFRRGGEGRIIDAELDIRAPLDLDKALRSLPEHTVVEKPVEWVRENFGFDLAAHGWERIGQDYAHDIFRSQAFADAAREAGYDTLQMTEGGYVTWGVLDPAAIVQIDRTLNQEDIFYSALERAVAESKQAKATGQQWAATLRKTPGVKQEELEWTGLLEFLTATSGPITREQLQELLAAGGVQVEEVMLGDPDAMLLPEAGDMGLSIDLNEEGNGWIITNMDGEHVENFRTHEEAERWIRQEAQEREDMHIGRAQFQSWSSDPSNETYRELLITLPVGQRGNPARAPSTHWDVEAVVAHTRFMDKTDADGKRVLFVEEIQSDWHQKGRDQGYEEIADAGAIVKARSAELVARSNFAGAVETEFEKLELKGGYIYPLTVSPREAVDLQFNVLAELKDKVSDETYAGLKQLEDTWNLRIREANAAIQPKGIPNAPFKSSWPALVMKRLIRYAAENGYDRIAWTTGEEQAERYNLAASVGTITIEPVRERRIVLGQGTTKGAIVPDSYRVVVGSQRAAQVIRENIDGVTWGPNEGQAVDALQMNSAQLKEAFGADIAKRLLEGVALGDAGFSLSGQEDLRIGGEGMKAFYDRNLVNITNDIIKKYGAKVGPVVLETPAVTQQDNRRINASLNNTLTDQIDADLAEARRQASRPGFEITDKMREAAMSGFALFQQRQRPRGSTTFLTDGTKIVSLFETANESTLVHEFGHIWLEELRADALDPGATEEEKADWQSLVKWWKAQGIDVGDEEIPEAAHEYFARTFERYFREGRAPRRDLRAAFKAFSDWLKNIYRAVRQMNAPINPTLRGIFDRMLATDEAIDAYRAQENVGPLFNNAEEAGMTGEEFAAYTRLIANARDDAYDTLLEKTMAAVRRKRLAEYREQRSNIRSQVAEAINAQPEFVALHLLRTGRWLGDPERERQDVKLNTGWLIDTFGETILDQLPRGLPITRGDGQHGDVVAEMVGAPSGQALVNALVGMRTASEALRASGETRSLRDKMIDEKVDEVMADRHGDPLDDGTIEEEAVAALNTATQGEVIAAEARQLAKRATRATPLTPYQFAREWAKRKVMAGRVNDMVSRSALQRYTRATAKAARLAEAAILEGDADEAYRQKQAQLLNHALLAESKIAADEIDRIIKRMQVLGGRAAMKSVDQDYMDKIHMLLENYDFRQRSQRSIDEQLGFQEWLERQRDLGFEVHIPPRLENRGEPFSRVTVEELMSLNDLVQSLLHLGKTKQKLKTAREERDFNEFVDEVVANVEQLPQRKLAEKPINQDQRLGAGLAGELLKVETIVEELDGGPTGPLHDAIVLGATTAENRRNTLRHSVLLPIVDAYHNMTRKQRRRMQEKVTLGELTWNTLNEGDPRLGQPVTITRSELLSIALNMGNLSNLEKLSKGERWPVPVLQAIMDREMTKEDWDLVQLMWNQVDSLWTDIVATEREMSGVVPEKVVPVPIETRFGTYQGGYWPVVYDAARWQRAENLQEAKLDDMFGIASGVATQKGHTISRTQAFGPIELSLENVLFQHLEQVVTRVAFTAYARDVMRIIQNPRIRGIIDTRLGPEYRKQIKPWLSTMIHEGMVDAQAARWWQSLLKQARINMMVAAMGFRFSTGIAQTLGLTASAQRIGALDLARGLKQVALHPRRSVEFAFSRSPELVNRTNAANREVSEVFAQLRGKHSRLAEAQAWAFWHIGMIDRYMVALPTWIGAHQKGMREGMTDAEASAYADKSVRLSQGAGPAKDLSAWQSTNNPAMRFFTMFYSPFNVMFNAQWQGIRGLKKGQLRPIIGVTFWWMIVSMLADAIMSGDAPDDWEDPEAVAGWFGRNVFFGMFAGIPFLRDMTTHIERTQIGEYSEFGQTPVTRIEGAIEDTYRLGDKAVTEGDLPERPIKKVADLTAILTGAPVSQAGTSGQFLWDYSQGETDPQSFSDWYFGVTRGRVPEEKESR